MLFNGEIYNYRYLAHTYLKDNSPESDTKVLYALLEKFGDTIVDKLDGMFAFIYIDIETDAALVARDYF